MTTKTNGKGSGMRLNADALNAGMRAAESETAGLKAEYKGQLSQLRTLHKRDDSIACIFWAKFAHRNVWRDADTVGQSFGKLADFIRFAFEVPEIDDGGKMFARAENRWHYLTRTGRKLAGIGQDGSTGAKVVTVESILKYIDKNVSMLADVRDVYAVARAVATIYQTRKALLKAPVAKGADADTGMGKPGAEEVAA